MILAGYRAGRSHRGRIRCRTPQPCRTARPETSYRLLIYVVSTYTFYKIIIAICNIIKVQKYCQPIWQSLKNINLADAAVSILSLQVALIATFSSYSKMLTMNIITGSIVSLGVIAIGLFMIINSTKKIKLLKKQ